MDALVIFNDDNDHPLAWALRRPRRHCWCALRIGDYWVINNWHQGVPIISLADGALDLAAFYRDADCEVIEMTRGTTPSYGPLMVNACVAHVMVMCGIRRHWLHTPEQLWNHLTGNTMSKRIRHFFSRVRRRGLSYAPGFGGNNAAPLPITPTTSRGPPSEMAKRADANLAEKERRAKLVKGKATTPLPPSGTLLDDIDEATPKAGVLR